MFALKINRRASVTPHITFLVHSAGARKTVLVGPSFNLGGTAPSTPLPRPDFIQRGPGAPGPPLAPGLLVHTVVIQLLVLGIERHNRLGWTAFSGSLV